MTALSHQTNRPYKKEVVWSVYRAKPDADGKRQLIATEIGPQFTFQLREGRYLVVATAGDLVGELPFDVKAGKTDKIQVVLKEPAPPAAQPTATEPVAQPTATDAPAAQPTAGEPPAAEPTKADPAATTSG
jgi:hypothetical protein